MFPKKATFENFTKFAGKYVRGSLFEKAVNLACNFMSK